MKIDNDNRKGIVYSAQCVINNKRYIGQSGAGQGSRANRTDTPKKMLAERRSAHENAARNPKCNRPGCRAFYNALRKHGPENFQWEIVATTDSQSELDKLEKHYIRHFNTRVPPLGNGYNLKEGGDGGALHPESVAKISAAAKIAGSRPEVKAKRSVAAKIAGSRPEVKAKRSVANKIAQNRPEVKARNSAVQKIAQNRPETRDKKSAANRGKKLSAETRAKLSTVRRGKKHSAETRAKLSEAKRGANNPNFGKSPSAETRAKLSEASRGKKPMLGKKHSAETRAKISVAGRGKQRSAETRKRMKVAWARRKAARRNVDSPSLV